MWNRLLGLVASVAAVALMTTGLTAAAGDNSRPSGGRAVAHRDGKSVAAGKLPAAVTYSVSHRAVEPTLGLDPKGRIYYAAADVSGGPAGLPGTQIMRSDDGGKTWKNSSPRLGDRNTMPVTLDPYVYVDETGGKNSRVFTIDLTLACSYMSFSDDGGESWVTNPLSCGRAVNDHQTLFTGPPVSTQMPVYPNVVYYCWNDVGTSSCSKSIDGGVSFHPTGEPAFAGVEPDSQDPGFFGVGGFCGGLHGHGVVAPNGTVYLPREYCGKPMVAISHDEGRTWDQVEVSKIRSISQPKEGAGHPSVAVDKKGNVYYMWINAENRLPYLSVSKNEGKSWSEPVMVGRPGLRETNLPQIDARGDGKIAMVYYGSSNSPFPRCKLKCDARDYQKTTWNAYVTIGANALDADPVFYTGAVAGSDPLVRGECGPGRCHWPYDFIDVEIGPDGIAYGAFVDGCMKGCTAMAPREGDYEGLVTKLVGGPSLD